MILPFTKTHSMGKHELLNQNKIDINKLKKTRKIKGNNRSYDNYTYNIVKDTS